MRRALSLSPLEGRGSSGVQRLGALLRSAKPVSVRGDLNGHSGSRTHAFLLLHAPVPLCVDEDCVNEQRAM